MFYVRADGEVWPCCNAVFHQNRYSFPAGNVREKELGEIWNGDLYRTLRRGWFAGRPPDFCRICPLVSDTLKAHLRTLV